ncbi:MAG: putative hydrolase or acyltransferase of alpha/beta superfamily [Acidimicrobiales bacterium]|nr:putative hydrolase or acyltransferase of alpha/beta superfamily [Acidimicrobiales bacterium]
MTDHPQTERTTISLHGHDLFYRRAGEGPVLLLVHGMAGSSATWKPAIEHLAEHFTVIAPDLPGHGRSDKPRGDYSLGAYASVLRDLLKHLDLGPATVVGQSLGGGITLQFAYQYPELCQRLVLVCAGGLGEEVSPLLRALAFPGVEYALPPAFAPVIANALAGATRLLGKVGLRPSPEVVQMWLAYSSLTDSDTRTAFLHTLRAVVDHRGQRVSALDKLYLAEQLPTLIVWGDADRIIPVQHAYDAHEAIPGSRLEIFEGCGHFLHAEEPVRFARLLRGFVATTEPPATVPSLVGARG